MTDLKKEVSAELETPRTDKEYFLCYVNSPDFAIVRAEFARKIERELAEANKDAARYRWLRESDWDMFEDRWINATWNIYGGTGKELDAAIDGEIKEAMK